MRAEFSAARNRLKTDVIEKLDKNLGTLTYMEGEGLFSRVKSLVRADVAYLLIGLGGTGIKKLCEVKKYLYKDFNEESVRKSVRFLAIDTDDVDLRGYTALDYYTECLHLKSGASAKLADPNSPNAFPWVNPQLNANISAIMGAQGWAGDGAGARRQVGRVKLCDPTNRADVKNRIAKNIHDLNEHGDKDVRVIVIAGIAGGTGSGTVIDIPYIVRSVNGTHGISLTPDRYTVEGYILLPPACGIANGADAIKGNRNAYAALKEIDYFMNLDAMSKNNPDCYYRLGDYTSTENLFNVCTLVDGMFTNGGVVKDPAKLTDTIVAQTIGNYMKAITPDPSTVSTGDRTNFFGTAQYMNNLPTIIQTQVLDKNYKDCPREANYRFLAAGYSEVIIPIELMKTYVVKKIFDVVWEDFHRATRITDQTVWEFLNTAGLTLSNIHDHLADLSYQRLPDSAVNELDRRLKDYGPLYMINLCKGISDVLTNEAIHAQAPGVTFNRQSWDEAEEVLRNYRRLIINEYHNDYAAYTIVLQNLGAILHSDAGILMDSTRIKRTFGESFCWTLVDFSSETPGQRAVREYLDGLLSQNAVRQYAEQFRGLLVQERDKLVGLFDKHSNFDAANVIRQFVNKAVGNCVDATVEDFLVKLFGADDELNTHNYGNDPVAQTALNGAAEGIRDYFASHASPLAQMDVQDTQYFISPYTAYIIPRSAPNLLAVMRNLLGANNVYAGDTNDRMVCVKLYAGAPTFFYEWIKAGEKAYESDVNFVGLHMEQSTGLMNWANLPNLIPEERKKRNTLEWNPEGRNEKLLQDARALISKAKTYGLIDGPAPDEYVVQLKLIVPTALNAGNTIQARVATAVEEIKQYIRRQRKMFFVRESKNPNAVSLVDHLLVGNWMKLVNNYYAGSVSKPGCNLPDKDAYVSDLAAKLLRKSLPNEEHLRLTIAAMEELERFIATTNRDLEIKLRFQERFNKFLNGWAAGAIIHDTQNAIWYYMIPEGRRVLTNYSTSDRIVQIFNLYQAYMDFVALDDKLYEQFEVYFDRYIPQERKNFAALNAAKSAMVPEIRTLRNNDDYMDDYAMKSDRFEATVKSSNWVIPNHGEVTKDELTDFYKKVETQLTPTTQSTASVLVPDPVSVPTPATVQPVASADAWTCPTCGEKVSHSHKFCGKCGTKKPENNTWTCPACNAQNSNIMNFCGECGTKKPDSDSWTCPACNAQVPNTMKFCGTCGARRP